MLNDFIKSLILKLPFLKYISLYLAQDCPKIFLYHRFTDLNLIVGVNRDTFKWQLEQIKRTHQVMSLSEYLLECKKGTKPQSVVIITIDDGYKDFYTVAYPLLKEEKMAATFFIATAYLDNNNWFWWDKFKYVIMNTPQEKLDFIYSGTAFHLSLKTLNEKYRACEKLLSHYHRLKANEKESFVDHLTESMGIAIPPKPTKEYETISWEEIVEVSSSTIEIGSHSNDHKILTQIEVHEDLKRDIETSKRVIREKANIEVKTFAYPNGLIADYDQAVVDCVRENGFIGAVVAHDGLYNKNAPFTINRMTVSNSKIDFLWKLYGMHQITLRIKNKFS